MDTLSQTVSEAQDRRKIDLLVSEGVISPEEQYTQAVERSVCSRCQGAI